jgi:uncharacterized protein (TIGR03084 family)
MSRDALVRGVRADLVAEQHDLDALLDTVAVEDWLRPTRCTGWNVVDQVAHLGVSEARAAMAVGDPDRFLAERGKAASGSGTARAPAKHVGGDPERALRLWREQRGQLLTAIDARDAGARIAWYGPPMSVASMLTARLMETWAHGTDIAAALGRPPSATERLVHIAHLGVSTRAHSYAVRGLPAPTTPVAVKLTLPCGGHWTGGEPTAASRVEGSMLDFCLVVTRRRPAAGADLRPSDAAAASWLQIAQAYVGPAPT